MPTSTTIPIVFPSASADCAQSDDSRLREQVMAELAITYDGRHYEYDFYRYDYLADAVNYAKLQRSTPPATRLGGPVPVRERVQAPNESQRRLMAMLAISFQDGYYRLGTYRYDRLADAVNYAPAMKRDAPARLPRTRGTPLKRS